MAILGRDKTHVAPATNSSDVLALATIARANINIQQAIIEMPIRAALFTIDTEITTGTKSIKISSSVIMNLEIPPSIDVGKMWISESRETFLWRGVWDFVNIDQFL